ncbi:MAG: helix-turn-helix domain-containing protein [Pelagibacteraceae bacterium]
MGEVVKFPNIGIHSDYNKHYNPSSNAYWKEYCCELDAKQIERIVFAVSGYSLSDLRKHNRKKNIVDARQLFVMLCVQHTTYSYPTIGSILNRDHTSIMSVEKRKQSERLKAMLSDAQKITRYLITT